MSNYVPEEVIDQIRNSIDIVEVVSEYVQLKKQGKNFFGLCPFHNENTPSFSVAQEKQIFHCFGCGKGGNIITFIMEIEGYSFLETIKFLAERTGVALPASIEKEKSSFTNEQQNLLSAYKWLTKLYHYLLRYAKDGKNGYQYLSTRGITDETIDTFKLGFAPNEKRFTASFLEKKGFHPQLLVKAGILSSENMEHASDRFAGRVIFPIRNHLGVTVGFGARTISDDGPKYLNSSESKLFQKSKLLYNFDLAKKHIRKMNEVILFEGYMDVISSYQAGVKNAVATMGTSLTESQAKLLRRYVDSVVVCYDGDKAGVEATYKASSLLRQVGCGVKIAQLKDGMDPDHFIQTYGGEAFENEIIKTSDTFMAFYMNYLKKDFHLTIEADRIRYVKTVLKEIAQLQSSIEREYYLKVIANDFDVSIDSLKQEMNVHLIKQGKQQKNANKINATKNKPSHFYRSTRLLPAFHKAERQLLVYMLQDRTITDKVQEEIGASFNIDEHKIIVTHLYAYYEEGHPADVSLFMERLQDDHLKQLVAEIAMTSEMEEISEQEINDYIHLIREEYDDISYINSLKKEQRIAEQKNDPITAAKIGLKIIELQKKVKETN